MFENLLKAVKYFSFDRKVDYQERREKFILYKIIMSSEDGINHILQCSNMRNIFKKNITDIIYDKDILFSLPALQSCGLGIHYAKMLISSNERITVEKHLRENLNHQTMHRYGKYCLCYQDRNGKIFFMDSCTEEGFFMDPVDIALCKDLINQFDASQSFYIGFSAGLSLRKNKSRVELSDRKLPPYLSIIK